MWCPSLRCPSRLARRADINKRDENGMTALHYAFEGDGAMSVVSLVHAGCDVKMPAGPKARLPIDFAGSHQLKHVIPDLSLPPALVAFFVSRL